MWVHGKDGVRKSLTPFFFSFQYLTAESSLAFLPFFPFCLTSGHPLLVPAGGSNYINRYLQAEILTLALLLNCNKNSKPLSFSCSFKTFSDSLGSGPTLPRKPPYVTNKPFSTLLVCVGTISVYIWAEFWEAITDSKSLESLSRCRHFEFCFFKNRLFFSVQNTLK